jgi:hypothetical protein
MTILLPALAVTFAAFCVWLTVRVINRRERWAKRMLVVVVGLPVLYVASFGPACWWFSKEAAVWEGCVGTRPKVAPHAYWPIGWLAENGPRPVHDAIYSYAAPGNGHVLLPSERSSEKLSGRRR